MKLLSISQSIKRWLYWLFDLPLPVFFLFFQYAPPTKFLAKPKSRRAKRKGVWGKEFLPACIPRSGTGAGAFPPFCACPVVSFALLLGSAEYQNRKIFFSLIEKFFGRGRLKKMFRKFFCFAHRSGDGRKRWAGFKNPLADFP